MNGKHKLNRRRNRISRLLKQLQDAETEISTVLKQEGLSEKVKALRRRHLDIKKTLNQHFGKFAATV
jgi:seryl-tRNA synthetase